MIREYFVEKVFQYNISSKFKIEMKASVLFVIIPLFIVTQAFDVKVFLSLNCYKKEDETLTEASIEEHVFCERFTLNQKEVADFQINDFVVSKRQSIVFKNCDIGLFNLNFLKKFPNALSIQLHNVTLTMMNPSSFIKHPLRELSVYGGNISSYLGYKAWRDLPELRTFILGRTSGQYLENQTMSQDFFGGNTKLQSIKIFQENITSIDPYVFRGLRDLKSVHLTDLKLESIHPRVFSFNDLEYVNLSGNKFYRIPRFSENAKNNLQQIVLIGCNINNVTRFDSRYRKQLKNLILDGNKIQSFEKGVFSEFPNLRYLSMVGNQLKNITLDYFGAMGSLETLDVEWNYLNVSSFLPTQWNEEFDVVYLNHWSNEVKKEMGVNGNFSVVGKDVL